MLKEKGRAPEIQILMWGFQDDISLKEAERDFIFYYRNAGCALLNLTDGGEGTFGFRISPASKGKWLLSMQKYWEANRKPKPEPLTLEQRRDVEVARRRKISQANKGRSLTPDQLERLRVSSRQLESRLKKSWAKSQPVLDVLTGKTFPSANEAAKMLGKTPGTFSDALKKGRIIKDLAGMSHRFVRVERENG